MPQANTFGSTGPGADSVRGAGGSREGAVRPDLAEDDSPSRIRRSAAVLDEAQRAFTRARDAQVLANVRRIDEFRLLASGIYLAVIAGVLFLSPSTAAHDPHFAHVLPIIAAYFVLALGLFAFTRRSPLARIVSPLGLLLLDLPLLTAVRAVSQHFSPEPGVQATLSLGCFAVVEVMGMFTLSARWMSATALASTIVEVSLLHLARAPISMMLAAAAINVFLPYVGWRVINQLMDLAVGVTREELRREKMGRFFSPAVRDQIVAEDSQPERGMLREVTVLFSDIRDFTAMSEAMPSPELVAFLNAYQTAMVEVLFRHGAPSTSSSATGSWPTSAPRFRGPTTPRRRCAARSRWSRRSSASIARAARSGSRRSASASACTPARWWSGPSVWRRGASTPSSATR